VIDLEKIDWPALEREMEKVAARFDGAKEVRVVGDGTDLTFSLEARPAKVSGTGANMPSGEVFYSPLEDSANGVVTFSEYSTYYGASVLGDFGIGCIPGIQDHMRNTLFDEKIEGTIHLGMWNGFPFLGGTNESIIHWDMVKDLRGELHVDGELVQKVGAWQL
jgi:aminopeptidase